MWNEKNTRNISIDNLIKHSDYAVVIFNNDWTLYKFNGIFEELFLKKTGKKNIFEQFDSETKIQLIDKSKDDYCLDKHLKIKFNFIENTFNGYLSKINHPNNLILLKIEVKTQNTLNTKSIIVKLDNKGKILNLNNNARHFFAIENKNYTNKYIFDFFTEKSAKNFKKWLEKSISKNSSKNIKIELKYPSFWGYFVNVNLLNFSTQLNEIELKLSQPEDNIDSNQKYRDYYSSLFNSMQDGVIISNSIGNIIDANPSFFKITNLKKEDIIGKNAISLIRNLLTPNQVPKVLKIVINALKNGNFEPFTLKYQNRILEIKPLILDSNKLIAGVIKDITIQTQHKELITQSEQKYKDLFNEIPIGIFEIEIQTLNFVTINQTFTNLLEYKPEELLHKSIEIIFNKNGFKQFNLNIKKQITQLKPIKDEIVRFVTKKGKERIFSISASLNHNTSNDNIRFVAQDITEKYKLEEESNRYERFLATIFNSIPVILFVVDKDGVFQLIEGKESLVTENFKKWIGKSLKEIFYNNKVLFSEFIKVKSRQINKMEFEYENKIFEVHFSFIKDKKGQVTYTIGVALDKTENKAIESALIASEKKYRTLLQSINEGLIVWDENEIITYVNDQFSNILNLDKSSIIGKTITDYLHPDSLETFMNVLKDIRLKGNQQIELKLKGKDDKTIIALFNIGILYEGEKYIGCIAGMVDISEKIRQQDELTLLNANKDKMFSIISHDIRGPLSGIVSLTKLLREEYQTYSSEEIGEFAEVLHKSSSNLYKLMENLLEWSRLQRGIYEIKIESINLKDLINDIVQLNKINIDKKKLKVDIEIDNNININTDYSMLSTVLRNLLSNAIKFSYWNSHIQIQVKTYSKYILISVRDWGIGIPDKFHNKIFKLGETVNQLGTDGETGSGLGLILCSELIHKLNGKIYLSDNINQGTEINIELPYENKKASASGG